MKIIIIGMLMISLILLTGCSPKCRDVQEEYTTTETEWGSSQLITTKNGGFDYYENMNSDGPNYMDCVRMIDFLVPKKAKLAYELTTNPPVEMFVQILSQEDCNSRQRYYNGKEDSYSYHPLLVKAQTEGLDYGYYCVFMTVSSEAGWFNREMCDGLTYNLKIHANLQEEKEITKTRTITKCD